MDQEGLDSVQAADAAMYHTQTQSQSRPLPGVSDVLFLESVSFLLGNPLRRTRLQAHDTRPE